MAARAARRAVCRRRSTASRCAPRISHGASTTTATSIATPATANATKEAARRPPRTTTYPATSDTAKAIMISTIRVGCGPWQPGTCAARRAARARRRPVGRWAHAGGGFPARGHTRRGRGRGTRGRPSSGFPPGGGPTRRGPGTPGTAWLRRAARAPPSPCQHPTRRRAIAPRRPLGLIGSPAMAARATPGGTPQRVCGKALPAVHEAARLSAGHEPPFRALRCPKERYFWSASGRLVYVHPAFPHSLSPG